MTDIGAVYRAARGLRRAPGLLAFAAAALALGTAAPATMFSIAHGVLRELPVPDGGRLVHIFAINPPISDGRLNLRPHDVLALQTQRTALEGVAAITTPNYNVAAPDERVERRPGAAITTNTFRVLRVAPALGRDFNTDDALPGAPAVVLISDALWHARLGARPTVLGSTLRIDGTPTTIIGVMPPGFAFPEDQQLWLPLRLNAAAPQARTGWQYSALGRLRDGVTLDAANAELAGVARRLETELPSINASLSFAARPYREQLLDRDLRRILVVMVALVSCVLLIAAANVANLLVARAVARSRTVAVRAALGATRGRIIGEHLLEAGVIALVGGALGLALSRVGMVGFTRAMASELPYWATFQLELPVLLFGGVCIVAAGLAAGIVPALQASGVDVNDALRDEARGSSSFRLGRVSRGLVIAQISLSCTLLIVAGLMIKGVLVLSRIDGYEPQHVLTARFELHGRDVPIARVPETQRALLERLNAMAGVNAAALTNHLPGMWTEWRTIELDGVVYTDVAQLPSVRVATVSPGYFHAAGAAPLRGRDYSWADDESAPAVAIVNRAFAARYFPGEDAIGRRLRSFRGTVDTAAWASIIAVAPDVGIRTGTGDAGEAVYFPLAQDRARTTAVMVHAAVDPLALLPALRSVLDEVAPDAPLFDTGRLDRVIRDARTIERVFGVLFLLFGAGALLLAAVGLYGTMSFAVARRTREFGVRAALGARPRDLVWIALRAGLLQIVVGTVLGAGTALLVAPHFGEALFGMSPRDASVYALIALVLAVTAVSAAIIPALRAARLDPTVALRDD